MSHSVTIWRNVNVASFFAYDNGTYLWSQILLYVPVMIVFVLNRTLSLIWPYFPKIPLCLSSWPKIWDRTQKWTIQRKKTSLEMAEQIESKSNQVWVGSLEANLICLLSPLSNSLQYWFAPSEVQLVFGRHIRSWEGWNSWLIGSDRYSAVQ